MLKGKPRLLLGVGIAPIVYTTDKDFEEEYGITIYDFGCTPGREEFIMSSFINLIFVLLCINYEILRCHENRAKS